MQMISKTNIKKYVLERAQRVGRSHVVKRVGASIYAGAEAAVRKYLDGQVQQHPSAFSTLQDHHYTSTEPKEGNDD